jgi:hypothetical protein
MKRRAFQTFLDGDTADRLDALRRRMTPIPSESEVIRWAVESGINFVEQEVMQAEKETGRKADA